MRRLDHRWAVTVGVVLTLACASFAASQEEDADRKARFAIRQVVNKINVAWTNEQSAPRMREVVSDAAFAVALPRRSDPGTAAILDKEAFCAAFEMLMQTEPPASHKHTIDKITLFGPVAYVLGTTIHEQFGGDGRKETVLNVFARDESGWRMVTSVPADQVEEAIATEAEDEQAVRTVANAFMDRYRAEGETSPDRLQEILAPDFQGITFDGRALVGKEEALTFYQETAQYIKATYNVTTMTRNVDSVDFMGDGAIASCRVTLNLRPKGGGRAVEQKILYTLVLRREEERWVLRRQHGSLAFVAPAG